MENSFSLYPDRSNQPNVAQTAGVANTSDPANGHSNQPNAVQTAGIANASDPANGHSNQPNAVQTAGIANASDPANGHSNQPNAAHPSASNTQTPQTGCAVGSSVQHSSSGKYIQSTLNNLLMKT